MVESGDLHLRAHWSSRSGSIALVLSGILERIQLPSHTRVPSTIDVLCNVAGAFIGICVAQRGRQARRDGDARMPVNSFSGLRL